METTVQQPLPLSLKKRSGEGGGGGTGRRGGGRARGSEVSPCTAKHWIFSSRPLISRDTGALAMDHNAAQRSSRNKKAGVPCAWRFCTLD